MLKNHLQHLFQNSINNFINPIECQFLYTLESGSFLDMVFCEIMDVEDAISFFVENMSDCRKYGHYDTLNKEALKIIDLFKDKFII